MITAGESMRSRRVHVLTVKRRRQARNIMARAEYKVRAKVWLYPGKAAWHFVNLSAKQSSHIRKLFGAEAAGWGSLPVTVCIGETEWKTSIFPDSKSSSYLFAIKAEVRKKEHIRAGDTITATVQIR